MQEQGGRSKKILRQYKRYLGDQEAETAIARMAADMAQEATAQAAAQTGVAMAQGAEILARFPEFIGAIENAYQEYEDRINIATRNIEISSQELTGALNELERLNLNINAMLDSLGQALLFFNRAGLCSDIYSKACIPILGQCPAGLNIGDLLAFSASEKETFASWLEVVFSGYSAMDFQDLKKLLPQEIINRNQQIIELDYRPMYLHENSLSGVLLIATDVTYQRAAENRLKALQMEALKIQQIAMDRNGFYTLVSDLYGFADLMRAYGGDALGGSDLKTFKRALHTFKGQAAMYSLDDLGVLLHAIETDIRNRYAQSMPRADLHHYMDDIRAHIDAARSYAQKLFGHEFMSQGKIKTVDTATLDALRHMVARLEDAGGHKAAIEKLIFENFLSVRIFDLFYGFKREIIRLCEMSGKDVPAFHMAGDNVAVIPEAYGNFFKVLVHLARNISDHALETAEKRVAKGKNPAGVVSIHVALDDGGRRLKIEIGDDGRGIDPAEIRKRLKQKTGHDFAEESDQQVIYHIFDDDISSKQSADMLSGRGIGMSAIQETVTQLGGEIALHSDYAHYNGTRLVFTLPYTTGV